MQNSFEVGIIRILDSNGSTAGIGFIVSEQLVVTCAHVVQFAGGNIGKKISLCTSDDKIVEAVVDPEFWRKPDAEDISILRLNKPITDIQSLILGSSSGTKGHAFSTLGFPKPEQELAGSGEIIGTANIKGMKLLQLRSPEVTPGFSGAPIFDETTKRVVGMVVAIMPPDDYQRLGTTAFAIPSETIREICPELQISDVCPYRGLDTFTYETAEYFFGREVLTQKLLKALRSGNRFLAVFGSSGSGKSSVVRAGVLPALNKGQLPGSQKWAPLIMRPNDDPFTQMKIAGLEGFDVNSFLEANSKYEHVILFIDQFEELFTLCAENQRESFTRDLTAALGNSRLTVIISMRDEFYSAFNSKTSSLASSPDLVIVNVPAILERKELEEMIDRPAEAVGAVLEEGLTERIVDDLTRDNEASSSTLPLLEFALTQLWEQQRDRMLTHEAYQVIGGVTGSLGRWADNAYTDLKGAQSIAESLLTSLVHLGDESQGFPDTRRRRTWKEFDAPTQNVIRRLTDLRLLITSGDTVELIHDALIDKWGKFKVWLKIDHDNLRLREDVIEAARQWKANGRDESFLNHRGARLELALTMSKNPRYLLNLDEQAYLESCADLGRREKALVLKRQQYTLISISIALVVIIAILVGWGWTSSNSSKLNESLAEQNATAAIKNAQLATQSAKNAAAKVDAANTAQANEQQAQSAGATAQANELIAKNAQATAEYSAASADSGALSALANSNIDTNYTLAMLFGLESYRILEHYNLTQGKEPDILLTLLQKATPELKEAKPELGEVHQVLFSPDGRLLATAGNGGVILRDTTDLNSIKDVKLLSEKTITAIAFSQDGSIFAAGGPDGIVTIWDEATLSQLETIPDNGNITSLSFSPDGKMLAVAGNGKIILWRLKGTTDYQRIISISDGPITLVAFRPVNQSIVLVSGGQDGFFRFWDLANPHEPVSIGTRNIYFSSTSSIAFSGTYLALGWENGEIQIYDCSNPYKLYRVNTISTKLKSASVSISNDAKLIAVGGTNGSILLYDISDSRNPRLSKVLTSHTEEVYSIAFHPKSSYMVSGGKDKATVIWDISQNPLSPLWQSIPFAGDVIAVGYNSSNKILAVSDPDKKTQLWDMSYPTNPKKLFYIYTKAVAQNIVFNLNGSKIATFDNYDYVSVWDTTHPAESPLNEFQVNVSSFLAFGNDLIFVNPSTKGIFDISNKFGASRRGFPAEGNICPGNIAIALSTDSSLLAMGNCDLNIWDITDPNQPYLLANNLSITSQIESIAISSDRNLLATGHLDNSIMLWDISQPESPHLLSTTAVGHTRSISSLAFSPDSKTLASGSVDKNIILWDISDYTAKPLLRATLEGHTAPILPQALYFSNNGLSLISASSKEVIVWNLDPQFWLDKACKIAGRNFTFNEWTQYLPGERFRATCPYFPLESDPMTTATSSP